MDFTRLDVEFYSQSVICRAWLYRPAGKEDEPGPCIVMAHGLGGTRDAGLEPYAEKFAAAGYVVLLFDYRCFGASDGEPRQLFSIRRQLQDWASAIDYARGLEEVDRKRVALWGTSFSGGHVIVAAAEDGTIAAVSAQDPMMDALAAVRNLIQYAGFAAFLKLGAFGIADRLRSWVGMSPVRVPIVAEPGQFAMMSSHDAASGVRAIAPPDWRNEICARQALTMAGYRPVARASELTCPTLIQVCADDSVAPPGAAKATARKIGSKADLKQYPCGHFDIYLGEYFQRASDEQLAFYDRVLAPRV